MKGLTNIRGLDSQVSWQSAHEGGKIVTPSAPAAFTPQSIYKCEVKILCYKLKYL